MRISAKIYISAGLLAATCYGASVVPRGRGIVSVVSLGDEPEVFGASSNLSVGLMVFHNASNSPTTVQDHSPNADHFTLGTGGAAPTFYSWDGTTSAHYSFDGSDQMTLTDDATYRFDSSLGSGLLTLMAWVKPSATNGEISVIDWIDTTSDFWYMRISDGQLRWRTLSSVAGGADNNISAGTITTGSWQHIAVSVSGGAAGDGRVYGYIDGVEVFDISKKNWRWNGLDGTVAIGWQAIGAPKYYTGDMDEVRVYDGVQMSSNLVYIWYTNGVSRHP